MEKVFLISVLTRQEIEGEKEELEIMTRATLKGEKNDYTIIYKEQEEDGSESETTLRVEDESRITVSREGTISTHLTLKKDVRTLSHHVTPYGAFSMGILCVNVESDMTENGGGLRFRYMTDIEMNPLGEIEFDITLSPIVQD